MHFNYSKNIKIFLILFIVFACGTQRKAMRYSDQNKVVSDKPSWVNNPQSEFPEIRYLSYVGNGGAKGSAERDAKSGLASIFRTKIQATTTLNQSVQETQTSFSSNMKMNSDITTSTDIELMNVKISKTYYDKNEDKYYVLASLDKMQTSEIYKRKTDEVFEKNSSLYSNFNAESDKVRKLGYIGSMHSNILQIEEYKDILSVLGYPYKKMSSSLTKSQIENYKDELLNEVLLYIEFLSGSEEEVFNSVKKEFTKNGFKITSNKSSAGLIASVSLSKKDTKLNNNPALFKSWHLSIKLENNYSKNKISVYNAKGRSSQMTKDALEQRCKFDINKKLNKEFTGFIFKNLFKQN
jgi:hypothetical protein